MVNVSLIRKLRLVMLLTKLVVLNVIQLMLTETMKLYVLTVMQKVIMKTLHVLHYQSLTVQQPNGCVIYVLIGLEMELH